MGSRSSLERRKGNGAGRLLGTLCCKGAWVWVPDQVWNDGKGTALAGCPGLCAAKGLGYGFQIKSGTTERERRWQDIPSPPLHLQPPAPPRSGALKIRRPQDPSPSRSVAPDLIWGPYGGRWRGQAPECLRTALAGCPGLCAANRLGYGPQIKSGATERERRKGNGAGRTSPVPRSTSNRPRPQDPSPSRSVAPDLIWGPYGGRWRGQAPECLRTALAGCPGLCAAKGLGLRPQIKSGATDPGYGVGCRSRRDTRATPRHTRGKRGYDGFFARE